MADQGSPSSIRVNITGDDRGLTSALRRAGAQVSSFSRAVGGHLGPALSGAAGAAKNTALAVTGLGTAMTTGLAASSVSASMSLNRLSVAFGSIFGDKQAQEMEFVRETANKLGLDLQSVAGSYQMIAAAARGTGMEGENVRKLFTAVSEAASALQLSSGETQGALLALSQMISKGKVSAEELRQQLGERLPGAFQLAAKAMGMTTQEFDKQMAAGKIMADDFLPKFADAMHAAYGEASVKSAQSFQGALNRVSNSFFEFRAALGGAITDNTFFAEALKSLTGSLNEQGKMTDESKQKLRDWAKQGGLAVLQFGEAAAGGLQIAYKGFYALKAAANGAAGALTQVFGKVQEIRAMKAEAQVETLSRYGLGNNDYVRELKDEAEALRQEADAAKQAARDMYADAGADAEKMREGSKTLEEFKSRVTKFREEMEKVEARPLTEAADAAKKTEEVWKKVGGVWVNVQEEVRTENAASADNYEAKMTEASERVKNKVVSDAREAGKALDDMARDRNTTVNVKFRENRATGGLVGSAYRFARGGRIPGFGGGDKVPAMLERGEYVIRKEAVRRFGANVFAALNSLKLPKLPEIPSPMLAAAGAGGRMTLELRMPGGESVAATVAGQDAETLRRWNRRVSHLGARR